MLNGISILAIGMAAVAMDSLGREIISALELPENPLWVLRREGALRICG